MILSLVLGLLFLQGTLCTTRVYNWTAGTGYANPDGVLTREVITVNGQFPWPDLRVNKGDRIIINLTNGLDDSNVTLHVHGIFQHGTNQMDGPPLVTQCPIAPHDTFIYNFTIPDQAGTYWYHSHISGQYMDGMKGLFIIDDGENNENYPYDYDEEMVVQISDWYNRTIPELESRFLSSANPSGSEPIPQNMIINNTQNLTWNVEPNKTYLLRIANTGGFISQYFWIEDHEMEVVEVDGQVTERNATSMLYISVAQRYAVLLRTKNSKCRNYAIMQKMDDTMLDSIPENLVLNRTSYLTYNPDKPRPKEAYVNSLDNFLDDFYLIPYNKQELLPEPHHRIELTLEMLTLSDEINYAFLNNITYVEPKVPTLTTVLSSGQYANNSYIYGTNTNTFILNRDEIVEIVLNNNDTDTHPFHLHGHVFQTIARGPSVPDDQPPQFYNPGNHTTFPKYPMLRDTVNVWPQSHLVIRYKADNPGVWFFHCHIEWHLMQGMAIVLVEDPAGIQSINSEQLTESYKCNCKTLDIPNEGNAAGTTDWFDLSEQNVQPDAQT